MLHLMSTAPICQEGIYFSLRGGLLSLLRAIFWLTPVDNHCSVSPSVGAVFSVRALVPPHSRTALIMSSRGPHPGGAGLWHTSSAPYPARRFSNNASTSKPSRVVM